MKRWKSNEVSQSKARCPKCRKPMLRTGEYYVCKHCNGKLYYAGSLPKKKYPRRKPEERPKDQAYIDKKNGQGKLF